MSPVQQTTRRKMLKQQQQTNFVPYMTMTKTNVQQQMHLHGM
jgi:hypothetical protein